ncbi:eukaryotic translation initiation factor 2 subunit alpha-like [Citrus sinensis]|nr:eukaryotic translation initiation factor 2 subunit alpha-like [Citrus sinensis]
MASHSPNLECRMYEARYPEVDMAVMIQVKNIADMGAYVSLLEYNNIEGMILFSELSRRRIRSVSSLIKVGRIEPVMVLRVDKEKGYIDLSKRRVSEEDIQACEERYNKSKLVHSIMRHVAETLGIDLEELYVNIGWPLYWKYGHAFEAFKIIVTDPDSVLNSLTREVKEIGPDGQEVTKVIPAVTEEVKDALVKNIRRRMTPQPLKIRADVEMKCFQFDGVLHIKDAMRKAEAAGNNDCPVKIKLVAPPLYVLTTQTLDKVSTTSFVLEDILINHMAYYWVVPVLYAWILPALGYLWMIEEQYHIEIIALYLVGQEQGISVLNKAIAACTEAIEKHKGKLTVKEEPRAVSERDDKLLAEHMAKLHQDNEEVSGDEDSEEEEDTGMGEVDVENSSSGFMD